VFKTMSYEDFAQKSAVLERWCTLLPPENKTLETLREAVDIKKVNSSFIKSGPNDNLIVDAYCQLYMEVTPTLDLDVKVEDVFGDGDKGAKDGPDQATKRIKGVGRRELLRKAEAAGINPALVSAQVLALRQAMERERAESSSGGGEGAPVRVLPPASDSAGEAEPRGAGPSATKREGGGASSGEQRFFDADDDESELSELDDIQSLDDEMQLVKAASRGSSVARSEGTAAGHEATSLQGEGGEGVGQLGFRETRTPSADGMEDVRGPKLPVGETAPE
jgi:hypothetical protein